MLLSTHSHKHIHTPAQQLWKGAERGFTHCSTPAKPMQSKDVTNCDFKHTYIYDDTPREREGVSCSCEKEQKGASLGCTLGLGEISPLDLDLKK